MRAFILSLLCVAAYSQIIPVKHRQALASQVATPTDSPGAGTYSGTQTVTLSDSTSGATICYTTDGSSPAASTPGTCSAGSTYSTGISVAATTTVKALGTKSGYLNSGILSSLYTISGAAPVFQAATAKIGAATTTLTSDSFSATAGGCTLATIGYQSAGGGCGGNTFSVADSESNAYTLVSSSQVDNAFMCTAQYYKCSVPGNASETVTVTVSPGQSVAGIMTQHATNVTALDQQSTGSNTSSTTNDVSTGSMTPSTSASIMLCGVFEYWITDTTIAAGTGFTLPGSGGAASGSMKIANQYKVLASTSPITPSFSITGTGNYNYSNMMCSSFK